MEKKYFISFSIILLQSYSLKSFVLQSLRSEALLEVVCPSVTHSLRSEAPLWSCLSFSHILTQKRSFSLKQFVLQSHTHSEAKLLFEAVCPSVTHSLISKAPLWSCLSFSHILTLKRSSSLKQFVLQSHTHSEAKLLFEAVCPSVTYPFRSEAPL